MHGEEEPCNECGYMESKCQCDHGDEPIVDETESRDQMAYEVAEDNHRGPDNGSANSTDARIGNDAANTDLAIADKKGPIAEEGEEDEGMFGRSKNDKRYLDKFDPTNVMNISDNPGMKAHKTTGKGSLRTSKEDLEFAFGPPGEDDTWVLEFGNGLIATIYPQSNSGGMDWIIGGNHPDTEDFVHMAYSAALDDDLEEDTTGEEAGKEEHECEKCHSDPCKCDDEEDDEEENVEESIYESYANSADDTFEADIDFMTKVISGGLNKQKSTGQTTIPVIAGQKNRMGADGLGKPMKESIDLLTDYRKLSGL